MKKVGLLAIIMTFVFVGALFGQSKDLSRTVVDIQEGSVFGVRDAKLETVWVKRMSENDDTELREKKTLLSFAIPKDYLNSNVILTAYLNDSKILGQSIWCYKTLKTSVSENPNDLSKTSNELLISLEVNSNLNGAVRYSLSVTPNGNNLLPAPETCAECVQVGAAVCGSRGVKSMTCGGTAGTCTFVCN